MRREGQLMPVAFFSKQLQGAERNYAATELEGCALFKAINFFAFYLYGRPFKVFTDHKALCSMMEKPQQNKRLLRWALKLTDFKFSIHYREGSANTVADWLSRTFEEDEKIKQRMKETKTRKRPAKEERRGRCERALPQEQNNVIIVESLDRNVLFCVITRRVRCQECVFYVMHLLDTGHVLSLIYCG